MERYKLIFIVTILSFFVTSAVAQQYTPMTAAGYQMKRIKADSTLHIPSFCGVPTLRNSTAKEGAIAMDTCNNKLYKWTNQAGWSEITGGSGGGGGTVTNVSTGYGLSGGPITGAGTLLVDSATLSNKYLRIVDTTDKWVTSVTKVNDSTIRVIKGSATNDILIRGNVVSTAGFVPYTGATTDLDMGIHQVNAQSFYATGSNGNGHIHLKHQSADATSLGQASTIWADTNGDFNWLNANKYKSIFFTSNQSANRTYTLQDKSYTLADNADLANKLNISDTANMLTNYAKNSAVNLKVNISDTANMLTNYPRGTSSSTNLAYWSASRTLTGNNNITLDASIPSLNVATTGLKSVISPTAVRHISTGSGIDAYSQLSVSGSNIPSVMVHDGNNSQEGILYGNKLSFTTTSSGTLSLQAPSPINTNRTINIPDNSGTLMLLGDTTSLSSRINLKANTSQSSYTFLANNTNATANMSTQVFNDQGSQTYSGTITWGTGAPSGTTNHSYRWTQVGKLVNLNIVLIYGTASSVNQTTVIMSLPTGVPNPAVPSGMSATNGDMLYFGNGNFYTLINTVPTVSGFVAIRGNAGGGYELVVTRATSAANIRYVNASVTYWTN